MAANREMSNKTWEEIDNLLHKIMDRAAKIEDREIYGAADIATALLRNFSTEAYMEDKAATRNAEKQWTTTNLASFDHHRVAVRGHFSPTGNVFGDGPRPERGNEEILRARTFYNKGRAHLIAGLLREFRSAFSRAIRSSTALV
jgi:hypothetical protein